MPDEVIVEENGNGDSTITARECTFSGFFKRVAYNLSGRRTIGYILAVFSIVTIIALTKLWPTLSPSMIDKAMDIVENLAIAFLAVQGIPKIIETIKGKLDV